MQSLAFNLALVFFIYFLYILSSPLTPQSRDWDISVWIFKQINQLAVCAEFSLSVAAGGSGLNPRQREVGRCAASALLSSTYSCAQWGQHVTPSSTQSIPSATLRGWTHSTIWVCSTPFSISDTASCNRGRSAARAAKYTSCAVKL